MRAGKASLLSLDAASASERAAWERELLGRARRLARRARVRAMSDRLAARLAACGLFGGAVAAVVWWATGLPSRL